PRPCNKQSRASEATWRSGYAADCKSVYSGSIPDVASSTFLWSVSYLREVWSLRITPPCRIWIATITLDFRASKLCSTNPYDMRCNMNFGVGCRRWTLSAAHDRSPGDVAPPRP